MKCTAIIDRDCFWEEVKGRERYRRRNFNVLPVYVYAQKRRWQITHKSAKKIIFEWIGFSTGSFMLFSVLYIFFLS